MRRGSGMRAAIWIADRWVELTNVTVQQLESPTAKTLAILGQIEYATGGVVRVQLDENTTHEDQYRDGLPEGEIEPTDPEPPHHDPEPCVTVPPNWGGLDPKDVDEDESELGPPWMFTLELADGTKVLNQSTMKGATPDEAKAHVLATWSAMAGQRAGKGCVEATYQAEGRVGEDQPDVPAPSTEGEAPSMFRWAAAEFAEEMETVEDCTTKHELVGILQGREGFEGLTPDDVGTQYLGHDERNDWNTWAVTVRGHGVGFLDGCI